MYLNLDVMQAASETITLQLKDATFSQIFL